jgi:cytoskeleton protein RodZ
MQTIGERLEEARKKKGISIREAAEATKIRGDYLQKFESNQFDIGLTEIYTRGFLRNYANFLKVPSDRILNDYAALGRGEVRPRQPSREIYGRMDISVSTSGETNERAAPPEEGEAADAAASQPRAQPRYPRSGGSTLPTGPDPALVFKYLKWGGIGVIVILALFLIKALFSDRTPASAPANPRTASQPVATPTQTAPAAALTYKLVATDPVQVRIAVRLEHGDSFIDGDELYKGLLLKNQEITIPLNGPQTIYASAGQNLTLMWKGNPKPLGFTGAGNVRVDIPPSAR